MEFRNSGTVSGSNQAYSHTPEVNPIRPNTSGINAKSDENFGKLENVTQGTPNTFFSPYRTVQSIEYPKPVGTPAKSEAPSTSSAFTQKQFMTSPNYTVKDPFIFPGLPLTSALTEFDRLGSPSPPYLLKQPEKLNDTHQKRKASSMFSASPQKQPITSSNYTVNDPFIFPSLPIAGTLTQPGKLRRHSPPYPLKQLVEPGRPNDTPKKKNAPSASPQQQSITSPNYTVKDLPVFIFPSLPLTGTLTEPGKLGSPSPPYPLKQLVEPGRPNDTSKKRKASSMSSASPQKQPITSPNYTVKDPFILPSLPIAGTLTQPGKLGTPSPPYPLKQLVEPGRWNDTPKKIKVPSMPSASPQQQAISSPYSTVKDPFIFASLPVTDTLKGPEPQEKTPEICLAYIWKKCKLEDKCTNVHYHLPYRWQEQIGSEWKDLSDMEDIEKAYSEPGNDSFKTVNFQTMTSNAKPVRRLSTPSSATQPPTYVLTTEWIWYWSDESGIWIEYGYSDSQKTRSSIVSMDLENKYLSYPKETFPFTVETNNYVINFQEMKQENTLFKTKREVRRRPKFLDCKIVRFLKGCTKLLGSSLKTGTFPSEWDMSTMPESGYQKVPLSESSTEFVNIVQMFQNTVHDHMVKRLWRIENSFLWRTYCLQKEKMKSRNGGREVYEQLLFHGTRSDNIDNICSENFDWRVCGTNGTVYGEGSYFARDASFSHIYSSNTSCDTLMMIVARVLVGDFVEGDSTMKLPPQKPNSTQRYDSCVNNISYPSIFVIFDKQQIYPHYILEYDKM